MSDFELKSKSVMIYINEETVNKLKEYPSIEEKDPITGEWTTATVTVEGMNNKKPKEEDNNGGLEYTEEEIAYNKIDDVMFDKKYLNTEIETHVKTVEEDDEEICKINNNLKHDQAPFIYRDDGETTWDMPKDYNAELRNILFYFGIFFMLFKWINKLIYVQEPKCVT